ncbi:MAG TPA: acetyltransferase, partial [Solirubrobacteraceae bacterium]|nr:acetyltransferase [Solirubrobacteraceae bacterium]
MSATDLLIMGAGGFARETAEAVHAVNALRPTWRLRGFLDDDPARHGTTAGGLPILGGADLVHEHPDAAVLICTGRPDNYLSRRRIAARLDLPEERYATVVHPTASVGRSCRIGRGSVLLAHVDVTADVEIGRFVAVMPQVVLTHDVRIDDWSSLAAAVRIGGACQIGQEVYLGGGSCLREGISIGRRAMVGLGAVVVDDVPPERLWYGSPARARG